MLYRSGEVRWMSDEFGVICWESDALLHVSSTSAQFILVSKIESVCVKVQCVSSLWSVSDDDDDDDGGEDDDGDDLYELDWIIIVKVKIV